jgi:membrane-associated phospholipid phosphatase
MEQFFSNTFLFGEETLNSIHLFAGSWLDWLMLGLTSLGSENFYLMALPLLYWCWDRKKTLYVGAAFLVSISLNDIVKTIFLHPRPDPAKLLPGISELAARYAPQSPGFPSGHSQGSIAFWGTLVLFFRERAVKAALVLLILLVSYSRIYLGVHFMGDVIGGLVIGLACLAATIPVIHVTGKRYHAIHPAVVIAALLIIPIALYLFVPGDRLYADMGTISGFLIGAYLAEDRIRFNPRNRLPYQIAKILLGIAGLAAIRFGLKAVLPDIPAAGFIRYWLIGAWVSIGAPYLFSRISPLRGDEEAS